MSLSVGLVGLPNAGKSTLFNALVKRQMAQVGKHPFTTISPNKAMVDVPDENLDSLAKVVKTDYGKTPQIKPARLTIIDIAGLVKGAHAGEGLGNEFLGHIRQVDAILHVIRAFKNKEVSHPLSSIDPQRDLEIIETELLLADLSLVEKHLNQKKPNQDQAILKKLRNALAKGITVRDIKLSEQEKALLGYFPLLTEKPQLIVLNVNETEVGSAPRNLNSHPVIPISAKLEEELLELEIDEQKEYLQALGIKYAALEAILAATSHLLELVTFYTIAKGTQVSAWAVKKNTPISQAVRKIHTDMEKGFIKAEVIKVNTLAEIGSWKKAALLGKIKLVGRDYLVEDGDVIEVKLRS